MALALTGCSHRLDLQDSDSQEWEHSQGSEDRSPKLGRYTPSKHRATTTTSQPATRPRDKPPSPAGAQTREAVAPPRASSAQTIGSGTCFAIDDVGTVVTANHVVSGSGAVLVKFEGSDPVEAAVVRVSEAADLAILKIDRATPEFLALAPPHTARLGSPVFTIGFPRPERLGVEPKFANGAISALSGAQDAAMMQITVPVQPGNSGGPLVSVRGEALGVIVAVADPAKFFRETGGALPQGINFASKSENLLALLPSAPARRAPARNRDEAIDRAAKAACLVVTVTQGP